MVPSAPAQRFALALPGAWLQRNQGQFHLFGGRPAGPANRRWARRLLQDSWGVDGPEALQKSLAWLRDEGHSAEWAKERRELAQLSAEERQQSLQGIYFDNFNAELGERGLVAWDMARLINVAGWGFLAGWHTEAEAWAHILPAARRCQQTYGSWEEYGRHYVLGCAYWSPPASEENAAAIRLLLDDSAGPWRTIPWSTALGTAGAAPAGSSGEGGGSWGLMIAAAGCLLLGVVGAACAVVLVAALLFVRSASDAPSAPTSGGAAIEEVASTAAAAPGKPGSWDGASPFVCKGNQDLTLRGVRARLDSGVAITAQGNCKLTLIDLDVEAPVAVKGEGNAQITVQGGRLKGETAAVQATALSKFKLTNVAIEGKVDRKGAAKVEGP